MISNKYFVSAITLISASLIFCMLIMLLWGINRGFDYADEGSWLLMYDCPSRYPWLSSFPIIVSRLPKLLTSEVCNYRLLNIIAYMAGSTFFSIGISKWLLNVLPIKYYDLIRYCYMISLLGNYASLSCCRAIGYNSLTSFFIFSSVGCLFYGLGAFEQPRVSSIAFFLSGLLAGLQFFAKAPSSLIYFFISTIFITMYLQKPRPVLATISICTIGYLAGFLLYFHAFQNFYEWTESLHATWRIAHADGYHSIHRILNNYFTNIQTQFARICTKNGPSLWLALVGAITIFGIELKQKRTHKRLWSILFLVLFILTLAQEAFKPEETNYPCELFYALYLVSAICLFFSTITQKNIGAFQIDKYKLTQGLVYLSTLPIICSLGTTNPLIAQTTFFIGPILVVTMLFTWLFSQRIGTLMPISLVFTITSVLAFAYFANAYVLHPYYLGNTLFEETSTIKEAPRMSGLLVNKRMKSCIENLNKLLRQGGFQNGDLIIALFDMPGLVYAVHGSSFEQAWFYPMPGKLEQNNLACAAIEKMQKYKPEKLFLLLNYKLTPSLIKCFERSRYPFPENFLLLGKVKTPMPDVWLSSDKAAYYLNDWVEVYKYVKQPIH